MCLGAREAWMGFCESVARCALGRVGPRATYDEDVAQLRRSSMLPWRVIDEQAMDDRTAVDRKSLGTHASARFSVFGSFHLQWLAAYS